MTTTKEFKLECTISEQNNDHLIYTANIQLTKYVTGLFGHSPNTVLLHSHSIHPSFTLLNTNTCIIFGACPKKL